MPETILQFLYPSYQLVKRDRIGLIDHRLAHGQIIASPVVDAVLGWNQADSVADIRRIIYIMERCENTPMVMDAVPKIVVLDGR